MKNLKKSAFPFIILILTLVSCQKWDEYKDLLPNGGKVYPGIDTAIMYQAGNNRALLAWKASPDQRVVSYTVYWNNKMDSLVLDATSHNPKDTVKALIQNLSEGFYTFIIHSFNVQGKKSVPVEKNNLRIYGPIYQKSLLNRDVKEVHYNTDNKEITINFNPADEGNAYTQLSYMTLNNNTTKVNVPADQESIVINDRKKGARIYYQSFYKPTPVVIDLFGTVAKDSIIITD
ncbi:MAG: DUF4998 domain-containing protein [Sphingobacterium sp.]